MEQSILISTKKILGLAADYTPFDPDVTTFINAALSTLSQIGIGPPGGVSIEDDADLWDILGLPADQLNLVKTYISLKVKFLFDPPTTRFTIQAAETQLAEHEWRLMQMAENQVPLPVVNPTRPAMPHLDGDVEYVPIVTFIEGGY